MTFYVLVYYVATGWHVLTFDNAPMCNYWIASNATRLHGALYANGATSWDDTNTHRCIGAGEK